MPDWSYRTFLRPCLFALGAERARRLATSTLSALSRLPFGTAAIDFLGHMRADDRLRTTLGDLVLPGPIALGSRIDPSGKACRAFARFGAGLLEIGPVAEHATFVVPQWRTDFEKRTLEASSEIVSGVDEVARNLEGPALGIRICIRIGEFDPASIARIVARLEPHADLFSVDADEPAAADVRVRAAIGTRPVLLRIAADTPDFENVVASATQAGAAGVWIAGEVSRVLERVRSWIDAWIVAGGVTEPEDARLLLEAGADVVATDTGLVVSGPGLVKRCNEALLSRVPAPSEPEPLSLDAARRSWFWAFLLGAGMVAGGLLALLIASTRVVLPYDESLAGMTRAQLAALNERLLAFMAHDRASLAGTMLSIGIFYAALAWNGVRRGAHWAQVTVIASAITGFLTFFFFLGFGYFDPFHAFVTAILTQFTLLAMVLAPSPPQPEVAQWREDAAWRRGQWGQLLFVMIGVVLTGAGAVIAAIGCTSVFVDTDLEFMRTTREQLHHSYETLVPLVAHDRASLGGMLIANGIAVWLMAQWGFRAGARWLWTALAWGGNLAFACATIVHVVVGYHSPLHLAPAMLGWVMWNVALALSREWMAAHRRTLCFLALLLSPSLYAQPRVSEETELVPASTLVAAADRQFVERVVASPREFLVTWEDWRSKHGPYGARIDVNGAILDPLGIELPSTLSAWTGRDFLLLDVDYNTGRMTAYRLPERGGELRETVHVPGGSGLMATDLASSGDGFLVLASDTATHDDYLIRMHAILVDDRGQSKRITLSDSFWPRGEVFVSGSRYIVLMEEKQCRSEQCPRNTHLVTIERDGTFEKRLVMANGSDDRHHVASAFNGRQLLIVMARRTDDSEGMLEVAVIDVRTGKATARRALGVFRQKKQNGQYAAAAWDGQSFVSWWRADDGIRMRRVATDGALLGEAQMITTAPAERLAAAASGAMPLLAWSDGDLHAKPGTASPMLVARAKPRQHKPRIAALGSEVRIARRAPHAAIAANDKESVEIWIEPAHETAARLVGQRFDAGDQPIGEPVVIDGCEGRWDWPVTSSDLSIASDGNGYLAIWPCTSQRGLRLVRLDRELRALSQVQVEPHRDQYASMLPPPEPPRMWSPRVVWNGSAYLGAWFETTSKGPLRVVRWEGKGIAEMQSIAAAPLRDTTLSLSSRNGRTLAAWVDYHGSENELCVVAWPIGEPRGTTVHCEPAIPFGSDSWNVGDAAIAAGQLVAWTALRNGQSDIFAARLDDLRPFPVADSPQDERYPELLAMNDRLITAAYQRVTPDAGNVTRNYARTIELGASDELAISGNRLGPAPRMQSEPRLAASPSSWLVVWRDDRIAFGETYGARVVSSNLNVLDPEGLSLFPRSHHNPRVAWTGWEFLVAAEEGDHIDARRVSIDGIVRERFRLAGLPGLAGLASNGKTTLVLAGRPLTAVLVGEKGETLETVELGADQRIAGPVQALPDRYAFVLHGPGAAQLVHVFHDGRRTRRRLPFASEVALATTSITPAGEVLLVTARAHRGKYWIEAGAVDGAKQEVAALDRSPMDLAAGWNGYAHVLSWIENSDTYARPVDLTGKPVADARILGQADPPLKLDAAASLTVWNHRKDIMAADSTRQQAPTLVSRGGRQQFWPRLASDGRRAFVAVRDDDPPSVIQTGVPPLGEGGFEIDTGPILSSHPGVAWINDHYLVMWTQWSAAPEQRLMAQRFDAEGKPMGQPVVVAEQWSGAEEAPSIASDGKTLVVAWPGNPAATILRLDGELRVREKRDVLGTYQTASSMNPPPLQQPLGHTQVVWTGQEWVAGWAGSRGLRFVRLRDGLRFEELATIPARQYRGMALTAHEGNAVAAWTTDEECLVSGVLGSDTRTTIACGVVTPPAFGQEGLLAWVNREGMVFVKAPDKPPVMVASGAAQFTPSVVVTTHGITVAYTRIVGVARSFVRTVARE